MYNAKHLNTRAGVIIVLLFVIITLLKVRSLVIYESSHVDNYYHSTLSYAIYVRGRSEGVEVSYASLPIYFIYQSILCQLLGGIFNTMIKVGNYLYLVFVLIIIIYLYILMRSTSLSEFNVKSLTLGIVLYILPFVSSYLYYPTSAPHIYALSEYICLLQIYFLRRSSLKFIDLIPVSILSLIISLSHHLTQLVLLAFSISIVLINTLISRRFKLTSLTISLVIIIINVLLSIGYFWIMSAFGKAAKEFLLQLLERGYMDMLYQTAGYQQLNLPWETYLLSNIKRSLMLIYLVVPMFFIIIEILSALIKNIPIHFETLFTIASVLGALPALLIAPLALERPLIFISLPVLLTIPKYIIKSTDLLRGDRYFITLRQKRLRLLLVTLHLVISLMLTIVTILHIEFYGGLGAPHVEVYEDKIMNVVSGFLVINSGYRVITDFWTTGILRYYISNFIFSNYDESTTMRYLFEMTINEYDRDNYRLAISHSMPHSIYVLSRRTIIRNYVFYPHQHINLHILSDNLSLIFNTNNCIILISE